jgi:hypothetical protein
LNAKEELHDKRTGECDVVVYYILDVDVRVKT